MNNNSMKSLYIECCYNNGNERTILSKATGFLVKNKNKVFLITNRHVVTGRNNFTGEILDKVTGGVTNELIIYINNEITNWNKEKEIWSNESFVPIYEDYEIKEENKLWIEHPCFGSKIDVIAINITDVCERRCEILKEIRKCKSVDTSAYEIELEHTYIPKVTEDVSIIGFPFGYSSTSSDGYFPIWSRGTIASEYEKKLCVPLEAIQNGTSCFNASAFLVDARTRKGQSGSPVIINSSDEDTILLGIYSR